MDFFDALVRFETDLWNLIDDRLQREGAVSLATLTAARAVARERGLCRVQELRLALGITVGAASKLVDRLERDGLAVRRANPADRRSSLIDLTPAGRTALARGVKLQKAVLDDVLRDEPGVADATGVIGRLHARLAVGAGAAAVAGVAS